MLGLDRMEELFEVKVNLTLLMEQFQFMLILIQFKAWNHFNMFVRSWIMNFVDESIAQSIVFFCEFH